MVIETILKFQQFNFILHKKKKKQRQLTFCRDATSRRTSVRARNDLVEVKMI